MDNFSLSKIASVIKRNARRSNTFVTVSPMCIELRSFYKCHHWMMNELNCAIIKKLVEGMLSDKQYKIIVTCEN